VTREEEIERYINGLDVVMSDDKITEIRDDLRYLLDKVKRLEGENALLRELPHKADLSVNWH
jgi:hypothetical protein